MSITLPSKFFADEPTVTADCPRCKKGVLEVVEKSFRKVEPKFSSDAHQHEAWDPDWIDYRFNFECKCNVKSCGEVCFVSGTGSIEQGYGFDGDSEYYEAFRIESFVPSPRLISIPEDTPRLVEKLLKKSFDLYWVDNGAAANALRASLEALLDTLKIPKTRKAKDGTVGFINLHQRIEQATKSHPDFEEIFFALKEVGNLGSHGDTVKNEHYSDALEIYAHVLNQLYQNEAKAIKTLAKQLRKDIKPNK